MLISYLLAIVEGRFLNFSQFLYVSNVSPDRSMHAIKKEIAKEVQPSWVLPVCFHTLGL